MLLNNINLYRITNELIQKILILTKNFNKGAIVEFALAQKFTKFDIYAILYSLRSKKQRSNEIKVREGGNLPYRYMGKILKIKNPSKDKLSTAIILRNVVDLVSFEMNMKIFSPLITKMNIKIAESQLRFLRSNSFFLRRKPPVASKSPWIYVIA